LNVEIITWIGFNGNFLGGFCGLTKSGLELSDQLCAYAANLFEIISIAINRKNVKKFRTQGESKSN